MKGQQTELIENQDVHNMKLHDLIEIKHNSLIIQYLRVPGGWRVQDLFPNYGGSIFVAYSKEFDPVKTHHQDYSDEVGKIIDYFNHARRFYRISQQPAQATFTRKQLIISRLKERFVFEDFKMVIDRKFWEWTSDIKMKKHLKIETLFRPSKFAKYLDEAKENNPREKGNATYAREPKTSV